MYDLKERQNFSLLEALPSRSGSFLCNFSTLFPPIFGKTNPPPTFEMSAGRQKFLKYVECHGKSCLGRTFHCARLHLLGIAIQMSEAYTTVISAWIVKNTN